MWVEKNSRLLNISEVESFLLYFFLFESTIFQVVNTIKYILIQGILITIRYVNMQKGFINME